MKGSALFFCHAYAVASMFAAAYFVHMAFAMETWEPLIWATFFALQFARMCVWASE